MSLQTQSTAERERARIVVRGAVQGVGFRPFVYRLAIEMQLAGWVLNSAQGVFMEIEGTPKSVRNFLFRLETDKPTLAVVQSLETSFLRSVGYDGFEIRESEGSGEKCTLILPDIATCKDCLREIFDPADRRYRYPFTNCTNCGPRFSIIESLPYDRSHTSMRRFKMCPDCQREYDDPRDRRFHAQPNACPRCGPRIELWTETGKVLASGDRALSEAVGVLRKGSILALKGIGGFQLMVDARAEEVVTRLRNRKHREEKPFAVMVDSLGSARELCEISEFEERLLASPEAPIVLLRKRETGGHLHWAIAPSVAPGNPSLGVMLPYSPLHHLLLADLEFPIVATSGNLSDEPICIDKEDALQRLRGIADFLLVHNRPIVRHVDDSVARVMGEREMVMRRARGYAPLPVRLSAIQPSILAVGAHLKNTVALSVGSNVFLSQHIGDLETAQSHVAFLKIAGDLPRLYEAAPEVIACDMHPDYLSTQFAAESDLPVCAVQHHFAHVAACMAENEVEPPALGVAWDGTGLGTDGTIWGGEFLQIYGGSFERVAHLRQFRLPGGDAAIREPRRVAAGVLFEIFDPMTLRDLRLSVLRSFPKSEFALIDRMLRGKIRSPLTSSAGRLFDAVAAIVDLRQKASFEGQAAMELEFAAACDVEDFYPFELWDRAPVVVDWEPMIRAIVDEVRRGVRVGLISAKFHNTLSEMILASACRFNVRDVILSGGCFQNAILTERCVQRLRAAGFHPFWHQRVPTNDGGIALGQIAVAGASARRETIESGGVE